MSNQLRLLFFIVVISGALCTVEDYVIMSQCAHNKAIHLAAEGTVSVTDISQTQNITIVGLPDYVNNAFKIALYAKETQRYLCFNDNWRLVGMKVLQDTCYFNETIVHGYFVFRSVVDLQRRVGFTHRGKAVGPKKNVNDACYLFTKIQADQFFHQHINHNNNNAPKSTTTTTTTTNKASSKSSSSSSSTTSSISTASTPQRSANRSRSRNNNNKYKKLRNNKKISNNNQIKQQHSQHGHNSNLSNSNSHLSSANKHKQLGLSQQLQRQQQRNNTREHVHHQVRHHHNDPNLIARRQQHENKQKRRQRQRQRTTTTTRTATATRPTTRQQRRMTTIATMLATKSLSATRSTTATKLLPATTKTTLATNSNSLSSSQLTSATLPTFASATLTAYATTNTTQTITPTLQKISPTSVVATSPTTRTTTTKMTTTSSTPATLPAKRKGHRRKGVDRWHKKSNHHKQQLQSLPLQNPKESREFVNNNDNNNDMLLPTHLTASETFNENYTETNDMLWPSTMTGNYYDNDGEDISKEQLLSSLSSLSSDWLDLDPSAPTTSELSSSTTVTDPAESLNELESTATEMRDFEAMWNDLEPSVTTITDNDSSPTSVRDMDGSSSMSPTSVRDVDSSLTTTSDDFEASLSTVRDFEASSTRQFDFSQSSSTRDFHPSPSASTSFDMLSPPPTIPTSSTFDPSSIAATEDFDLYNSSSSSSLFNANDDAPYTTLDNNMLQATSTTQTQTHNSSITHNVANTTLPTYTPTDPWPAVTEPKSSPEFDHNDDVFPTPYMATNMFQVEPTNVKLIQTTATTGTKTTTTTKTPKPQEIEEQSTSTRRMLFVNNTNSNSNAEENFYERSKAKQLVVAMPATLATLLHRQLLRQRLKSTALNVADAKSTITTTLTNGFNTQTANAKHRAGLTGDVMTEYIYSTRRSNIDNTSNSSDRPTQHHHNHQPSEKQEQQRNITSNMLLLSGEQKFSRSATRPEATQPPTAITTTNASNSKFIQAILDDFRRWNHLLSINKNVNPVVATNNTLVENSDDTRTTTANQPITSKASATSSSTLPTTIATTKKTLRKSTQKLMATPFYQLTYVRNKAGDIDIDSLDNLSAYSDANDEDLSVAATDANEPKSLEDGSSIDEDTEVEDHVVIGDELKQHHQKVKKHHHHLHHHSKGGNSRLTIVNGYLPTSATSVLPESLRLAKIKLEKERKRLEGQHRQHGA